MAIIRKPRIQSHLNLESGLSKCCYLWTNSGQIQWYICHPKYISAFIVSSNCRYHWCKFKPWWVATYQKLSWVVPISGFPFPLSRFQTSSSFFCFAKVTEKGITSFFLIFNNFKAIFSPFIKKWVIWGLVIIWRLLSLFHIQNCCKII